MFRLSVSILRRAKQWEKRKGKFYSPADHAAVCSSHTATGDSGLHLNHTQISCGEGWKLGPLPPSSRFPLIHPLLSFSPPLFHPSSLPPNPSSFPLHLPVLLCFSFMPFASLLPLFFLFPLLLLLLWSYPELNKPALSPLLSDFWPSAPRRMFSGPPKQGLFTTWEHKRSHTHR